MGRLRRGKQGAKGLVVSLCYFPLPEFQPSLPIPDPLAARGRSPFLAVAAVYDRRISLISGPSAVIDRRYSSNSHTSATGC